MLTRILIPLALLLAIPAMAADIPVEPHTHTYFSWEFWGYGSGTTRSEIFRNLGLALIAFVALLFGVWRAWTAHRQAKASVNQAKVAHEGHITDRFTKAVEQLGSENVTVRIGGVYALKRIAQDSIVRDHISVMDVLTNFIRYSPYAKQQQEAVSLAEKHNLYLEETRRDQTYAALSEPPEHPRYIDCPDIIAAIETIQARSQKQKSLEVAQKYVPSLKNADFSYLILNDVDLSNFDLNGVNLKYANVLGVNLSNVDLSGYELQKIELADATLTNIDLSDTDLSNAVLSGAKLDRGCLVETSFRNALLVGVDFSGANLSGADLFGANLKGANLTNADLTGADLTEANLEGANLSNTNFLDAILESANLFTRKIYYENYKSQFGEERPELTEEEFVQKHFLFDLSKTYTCRGQPPRNLREGIVPPPEKD